MLLSIILCFAVVFQFIYFSKRLPKDVATKQEEQKQIEPVPGRDMFSVLYGDK